MMRPIRKPPGGWPAGLQAKALKGEAPITVRPGPLLPAVDLPVVDLPVVDLPVVDLPAAHADAERRIGRHLSEAELSSWLMNPKVFGDFAAMLRKYGPLSVLPTPVFFHGMAPGDEITIEIKKGRRWWCACKPSGKPVTKALPGSFSNSTASRARSRLPTGP